MEKLVKLYISLHWMYPKLKYLEKENMKAVLDMLQTSNHIWMSMQCSSTAVSNATKWWQTYFSQRAIDLIISLAAES